MDSREIVIHVLDDDEAMRSSLRWLLESEHWSVSTHVSAEEFLRAWHPDQRGCLILDIEMPGIDGLELLGILAQLECDLPVIMITAHGDVPTAVRAMKDGVSDFLEKPFAKGELLACIDRALKKNSDCCNKKNSTENTKALYASLTQREREIMALIAAGKPSKLIAHEIGISIRTVEAHRARVLMKLNAKNTADLVRIHLSIPQ